jgi:hypothetical protein
MVLRLYCQAGTSFSRYQTATPGAKKPIALPTKTPNPRKGFEPAASFGIELNNRWCNISYALTANSAISTNVARTITNFPIGLPLGSADDGAIPNLTGQHTKVSKLPGDKRERPPRTIITKLVNRSKTCSLFSQRLSCPSHRSRPSRISSCTCDSAMRSTEQPSFDGGSRSKTRQRRLFGPLISESSCRPSKRRELMNAITFQCSELVPYSGNKSGPKPRAPSRSSSSAARG